MRISPPAAAARPFAMALPAERFCGAAAVAAVTSPTERFCGAAAVAPGGPVTSPTEPSYPSKFRSQASPSKFAGQARSEEHTSELQSLAYLVCRLLLEKKKKQNE